MKNLMDIGVKVLLGAAIVILFVLHLQSKQELVYVDAQKLMAEYKGTQIARKDFEGKSVIWKANLDTLRSEVESKMKDYETKKAGMSAKEKILMEELIQAKQDQFLNYQQVIQEKVQKEDQELTRKVLDKVNEYIKKYGKENDYKIILAATQYGNIVYAEDGIDITKEVLAGLNKEYSKP
jgi:outer membrane protein